MRSNLALISDISIGAPVQINGATTRLATPQMYACCRRKSWAKRIHWNLVAATSKVNSNIDHNVGKETPALISALKRDAATG
jgi:hypothetical protein